ncbi:hypothetical protein Amsp01_089840 [Amycolatopsis sp. NBRC 101858]|nr:hypothetical protein Amsp01_089840 [Amycolatopsis sp. NBRC 101858]
MSADFAHDGRHGEGQELAALAGVEPVDGVDQPRAGHLQQVLEGFAAAAEASGDVFGQREVLGDQLGAEGVTTGVLGREPGSFGEHREEVGVFAGPSRCGTTTSSARWTRSGARTTMAIYYL